MSLFTTTVADVTAFLAASGVLACWIALCVRDQRRISDGVTGRSGTLAVALVGCASVAVCIAVGRLFAIAQL